MWRDESDRRMLGRKTSTISFPAAIFHFLLPLASSEMAAEDFAGSSEEGSQPSTARLVFLHLGFVK